MHMEWTNTQVDIENLPSINTLDLMPLQRRYMKVMYLNAASSLFIVVAWLASTFIFDLWATPTLAILLLIPAVAIPIINFVLVRPSFRVKRFAIRDRDVLYQSGLIFRSLTVLPFKRVQHCEINRGPLSRLLGLSELNIYTAGGSSSDVVIPGLDEEEARQLCQFILQKIKQSDEEE